MLGGEGGGEGGGAAGRNVGRGEGQALSSFCFTFFFIISVSQKRFSSDFVLLISLFDVCSFSLFVLFLLEGVVFCCCFLRES